MTLRFEFFYANANYKYFLALLQKLANACGVDLRAEVGDEILCVFASADNAEILGKFADSLQVEVPHSLYFKLKSVEICDEARGEKIKAKNVLSVSEINAIKNPQSPRFCDVFADSANLKNICALLKDGHSVALDTNRGAILLSIKSDDFDFILANDIATIALYTRATQDEISALGSFEKPFVKLAIKEVFVREVGKKSAKFILPFDIVLCCLSSLLLADDIAFLCAKFAKSNANLDSAQGVESASQKDEFFEIVVGQNGYFLRPNYVECADFAEFLALNFGAESNAKIVESNANFTESSANFTESSAENAESAIIYLSTNNPSVFTCSGENLVKIAFDKNPKNILRKIAHLENGEKLIANFSREFGERYEAILAMDSAPQMSENVIDIFECASVILGRGRDKNAIFDLAGGYLREVGPKIDFKNGNLSWGMQFRTCKNFWDSADYQSSVRPKNFHKYKSHTAITSIEILHSQNLIAKNQKNHKKSFCYFWLLPKVESPSFLKTQIHQRFYNSAESTPDSTIPQNLTRKTQNRRISHEKCESAPDSVNSQNLARSAKSFCYFWLLPKVESLLPYQPQLTKKRNFVDSAKQNLIQNNCAKHPNLARFVVQKIGIKGAEVPPADFLLETDKRGTPPKSEKRLLFGNTFKNSWGERGRGAALLRKKTSESKSGRIVGDSKVAKMDSSLTLFRLNNNEFALFYDPSLTIRSIMSFTLAGSEPEVIAFGIVESLVDYLVLLFRDAQKRFGAKNICIGGDMFANKVFFDKITRKIPADFKLIFPKYLDFARRTGCKT